jgi:hypothetical protein
VQEVDVKERVNHRTTETVDGAEAWEWLENGCLVSNTPINAGLPDTTLLRKNYSKTKLIWDNSLMELLKFRIPIHFQAFR